MSSSITDPLKIFPVQYINGDTTKVKIICPIEKHYVMDRVPYNIKKKTRCPKCIK